MEQERLGTHFTAAMFEEHLREWTGIINRRDTPVVDLQRFESFTLSSLMLLLVFGAAAAERRLAVDRFSMPLLIDPHGPGVQRLLRTHFFNIAVATLTPSFVNAQIYVDIVAKTTTPPESWQYPLMPFRVVVPGNQSQETFELECNGFVRTLDRTFARALKRLGFDDIQRQRFWEPNKELVENIHYHSGSWGLGALELTDDGVFICYADIGIGMKAALAQHPLARRSRRFDDAAAIELAFKPGVTSLLGHSRGMGLHITKDFTVNAAGGQVQCRSGKAAVTFSARRTTVVRDLEYLPGVQMALYLPRRKRPTTGSNRSAN